MKFPILLVLVLLLSDCSLFWNEASWPYIVFPKVEQTRVRNADYIRISGLLMSSSKSVKSSKIQKISETEIWIHVKEGLVSEYSRDGNFDLLVPITDKTEFMFFGREKTVIWSRK
jgi:hypothetical protein